MEWDEESLRRQYIKPHSSAAFEALMDMLVKLVRMDNLADDAWSLHRQPRLTSSTEISVPSPKTLEPANAHTCDSVLVLPPYKTAEELSEKLAEGINTGLQVGSTRSKVLSSSCCCRCRHSYPGGMEGQAARFLSRHFSSCHSLQPTKMRRF